jgi:hypothetical protein
MTHRATPWVVLAIALLLIVWTTALSAQPAGNAEDPHDRVRQATAPATCEARSWSRGLAPRDLK